MCTSDENSSKMIIENKVEASEDFSPHDDHKSYLKSEQ
jgi:hypothetical protein